MLRVLHVVTHMNRGGLETMIMNYYRKIDRSRVQFDFLVHRKEIADYDGEIERLGGRIFRIPSLNPFSGKYKKALNSFFENHMEYDIIHSHLDCMAGIPLKYAKKHNTVVRIAHSHGANQKKDIKYPLKIAFKSSINKYANLRLACGEEAGKWMFKSDPFIVLPNAIDLEEFSYSEKTRNEIRRKMAVENKMVIGHVGNFTSAKNHTFLIKVFYEYYKRKRDTVLLLIGAGGGEENIQKLVQDLGLQRHVLFLGKRNDVSILLQAMDIFILPSLYEGFPVSIVEAQATGLPCIVSSSIDERCVLTAEVKRISLADSAGTWADHIDEILHNRRNRSSFHELLVKYDIIQNAKWLEDFYIEEVSKWH